MVYIVAGSMVQNIFPLRQPALGILLFSAFSILLPAYSHFQHLMKLHPVRLISSRREDSSGELITLNDRYFLLGLWRACYSSPDYEHPVTKCELEIINDLNEPILVCWVDYQGNLQHYYQVNDNSIKDKSVCNIHTEYTYIYHSFICIKANSVSGNYPKTLKDVPMDCFLLHYTPKEPNCIHSIHINERNSNPSFSFLNNYSKRLRSSKRYINIQLSCTKKSAEEDEVIDTTKKVYDVVYLSGFKIKYEPGVFKDCVGLEELLVKDLEMVCRLLPKQACKRLQESTVIWVSKSKGFSVRLLTLLFHLIDIHS